MISIASTNPVLWPRVFGSLALIIALSVSAGCTSKTAGLEDAAQPQTASETTPGADANKSKAANSDATASEETAKAETEEAKPNIIHKPATVTQRGTNIEAVVNGKPITNYDVQRRAAFLKLRRTGGDRNQKALDELVEERIKLQEAERLNMVASDKEVDEAFGRFAKNNRLSTGQLSQVLGQAGVGADHFKDYIRGQISWQRVVGTRFRVETRQKTTQEALFEIRKSGEKRPETTEFILQQVIFVIPDSKRKALLPQRRKEAYAFKQQFTNCDETAKKAVGLLDVTVRDLPRVLEPELPPEWSDQIIAASAGETTDIKNTDKGVEFIAVCSRKTVDDDDAVKVVEQAQEFEAFNENGGEVSQKYLAELKSRAQVIYR